MVLQMNRVLPPAASADSGQLVENVRSGGRGQERWQEALCASAGEGPLARVPERFYFFFVFAPSFIFFADSGVSAFPSAFTPFARRAKDTTSRYS